MIALCSSGGRATVTLAALAVLSAASITAHANSVADAKAAAATADMARAELAACQTDACKAKEQAALHAAIKDEYDQLEDVIHSSSWHYHKAAKDWARKELEQGFAAGIFTPELATEVAPQKTDLIGPDGRPMYEADCEREKECFEDISQACPTGYDIVSQDAAHERGLALASGGLLSVVGGSRKHGADIFYECKDAAPGAR